MGSLTICEPRHARFDRRHAVVEVLVDDRHRMPDGRRVPLTVSMIAARLNGVIATAEQVADVLRELERDGYAQCVGSHAGEPAYVFSTGQGRRQRPEASLPPSPQPDACDDCGGSGESSAPCGDDPGAAERCPRCDGRGYVGARP